MSVKCLKMRDPRIDISDDEITYVSMVGGSSLTTQEYVASSASPNSITFNVTTPSMMTGVDTRIIMEIRMRISCDGAIFNAANLTSTTCGLRSHPIYSIINNMQLRLNDQSFSMQPSEVIHALSCYNMSMEERSYYFAGQPVKPDYSTSYATAGMSSERNPFSTYEGSSEEIGRNFDTWRVYIDPRPIKEYFDVVFFMPLIISPLNFTKSTTRCLFMIQNISLTLTLGDTTRMLAGTIGSLLGLAGAGSVFTKATTAPAVTALRVVPTEPAHQKLHITYCSPSASQSIPSHISYGYHDLATYTMPLEKIARGAPAISHTFSGIQLSSIFKRCYIFARPQTSENLIGADYNMAIDKISITFNNSEGRLSGCSDYDLYDISCRNGYQRSYKYWSRYGGSVLALEPSKDLALTENVSEGVQGTFNWSMNVTLRDIRGADADPNPLNYTLYCVFVRSGVITCAQGLVGLSIGSLTEQVVKDSGWVTPKQRAEVNNFYTGGSFLGDLYKGFKKVANIASPLLSLIPDRRAIVASQVARAIGSARGGARARRGSLKNRL